MRVLVVTGTRDATAEQITQLRTDLTTAKPALVLVGDGKDTRDKGGRFRLAIDQACRDWCKQNGVEYFVGVALWDRHGKAAGPRRNHYLAVLAAACRANEIEASFLAYPGSGTGTQDTVGRLQAVDVPGVVR